MLRYHSGVDEHGGRRSIAGYEVYFSTKVNRRHSSGSEAPPKGSTPVNLISGGGGGGE